MSVDLMFGDRDDGFSLVECLVVVALLGILASLVIPSSSVLQRRLALDNGLRRLRVGLDRGRMAAERDRQPCALRLSTNDWKPPLAGDLPSCRGDVTLLAEPGADALEVRSNLPGAVRFSSNGLVLDGGLVVLFQPSHVQALFLVIGLPLGISRSGVYRDDPGGSLSSALCLTHGPPPCSRFHAGGVDAGSSLLCGVVVQLLFAETRQGGSLVEKLAAEAMATAHAG
ncbi:Tfp pilus assembly protein FimT/FimU, partial [Parasynechococcus sp.]|uniref:pilus assembly FimT family protein n=1 Tax=Parasynechococcus sp. TaxID=3101203 RepID=UPI003704C12A